MSKTTGARSILFGFVLALIGIGDFSSGKPSFLAFRGITIGFAVILGPADVLGGLNANEREVVRDKTVLLVSQIRPSRFVA